MDVLLGFLDLPWIINTPKMLAEHAAKLMGELRVDSPNKEIQDKLNVWMHKNDWLEKLYLMEYYCSYYGVAILFVLPSKDKENLRLELASASLMGRISKISMTEQAADIWTYPDQSDAGNYMHILFTKGMVRVEYYGRKAMAAGALNDIPEEYEVKDYKIMLTGLNYIPVVQIINKPILAPFGTATTFITNPDWRGSENIHKAIQKTYEVGMDHELEFNKTRMYGQLDPEVVKKARRNGQSLKDILGDVYVATAGNNYDKNGQASMPTIIQGEPRFDLYNQHITSLMQMAWRNAGYDWNSAELGESYQNKAGQIINNKLDVMTTKLKQAFRINKLQNIIDWVLAYFKLWDGQGERPYTLKYIENNIVDKMQSIEFHTFLQSIGAETPIDIMRDLLGYNQLEAETKFKENDKFYEEYNTLQANPNAQAEQNQNGQKPGESGQNGTKNGQKGKNMGNLNEKDV